MAALQDGMQLHGQGQAIVPRAKDNLPDVFARHESVGIVDAVADGCGYRADYAPDRAGAEALMPLRAVWHNPPAFLDESFAGGDGIFGLSHTDNLFHVRMVTGTENAKRIVLDYGTLSPGLFNLLDESFSIAVPRLE